MALRTDTAVDLVRISVDHRVMRGAPCVKGTRIPVTTVAGLAVDGLTIAEILADYPQLTAEDVQACMTYAAHEAPRSARR